MDKNSSNAALNLPSNSKNPVTIAQTNIFSQIRRENQDFFFGFTYPTEGYAFNQYTTVKRCLLYNNSQFEDTSLYNGMEKMFFNIVNPPCEVASKMVKIQSKNIRLWPTNPKSHFSTYLLSKELTEWLKTSKFYNILAQIAEELPIYGSVFLEKTKDGAKVVDIRRLICDQSVDKIENSRFITTIHYMTPTELRATGWDNVEDAINKFSNTEAPASYEDGRGPMNIQSSTPYIKVFKRYGEVPEYWLEGKSTKMVKSLYIVCGADSPQMSVDGKSVTETGIILFKGKWNKVWPYKDVKYQTVKGRLLGRGVIEMLFPIQERINEIKNQTRVQMELSSIRLFETPDKQIVKNVLTDLQNGDVIISPNGFKAVENQENGAHTQAVKMEEASYLGQADKLTFSYEAVRGDTPTQTTPLGTTKIAVAQASGVFGFKKENLCNFAREFFNDLVLPEALKSLDEEHIMRFTGSVQELAKIDEAAQELVAGDYIKKEIFAGRVINPEEIEAKKFEYLTKIKKAWGNNRYINIKKGLYGKVEFEFDYIIDNEQIDLQTMQTNYSKVIADLSTNPAILSNPVLKLMYFKYAEALGINQAELEAAENQAQQLLANNQNIDPNVQPNNKELNPGGGRGLPAKV